MLYSLYIEIDREFELSHVAIALSFSTYKHKHEKNMHFNI
jgi:hypothetical protein